MSFLGLMFLAVVFYTYSTSASNDRVMAKAESDRIFDK